MHIYLILEMLLHLLLAEPNNSFKSDLSDSVSLPAANVSLTNLAAAKAAAANPAPTPTFKSCT